MQLLTFAHRGEAQCFFKYESYQSISLSQLELYRSDKNYLLLLGEGVQSTSEKLSAALATLREEISEVINYGIAGSLSEALQINTIYSVRTAYKQNSEKMAYKSFTSSDNETLLDCVTANDRVLTDESANHLRCFGQLVDRELWAIGSVSHLFHVPFKSFKLVSDIAGNQTACFDLKHRALEFSDMLYSHYTLQNTTHHEKEDDENLPSGFHFSLSQQRILHGLKEALQIKTGQSFNELFSKIDLESIKHLEPHPKKRTHLLLQELEDLLNPFNKKLREKLNELVQPFHDIQCNVQFDKQLEKDHLNLTMKIEHETHLNKLKTAIELFDYQAFKAVLNGNV